MNKVVKINVGGVCLLFLLLLGVCASCQHERGTDADARRKMALHLLDESLNSQSPDALRKITQGMRQAPDSLSYYEYFARKGRWLCQSSRTDSTLWYNRRVLQFANGLPDSPRRNSLLAYTYNCQALNYHNFHKNADEVISLYQKAYEYSLRSDVQHQAPSICANLGDAYIFKSQLPEAAAWYRRALFLADSLHLPQKDNVTLYVGLGTIYLQLNDFEASFKCYRQLESSISQMPLAMQAYYLNNYGNYYYRYRRLERTN